MIRTLFLFISYWSETDKDHFYTTKEDDIGTTTIGQTGKYGYKFEGVWGYCFPTEEVGTTALYQYYNDVVKNHFYYTGETDASGYKYDGIVCFVYPYVTPGDFFYILSFSIGSTCAILLHREMKRNIRKSIFFI